MKRILSLLAIIGAISFTACKDNPATTAQNNNNNPPAESIFNQEETADLVVLMDNYYRLKDALVNDNAEKADEAANKLLTAADTMLAAISTDSLNSPLVMPYLDTIKIACTEIIKLDDVDVEKKRIPFEKVSDATYHLLQLAELKNAGIYRQYCPMAFNDKGAFWLSNETDIRNPYFGKKMLECGEVTDTIN